MNKKLNVIDIMREVVKMASEDYLERHNGLSPVKFIVDNFFAVGRELSERSKSAIGAQNKYPAIILFTDNLIERYETLKQWQIEATMHIVIVADAASGNGDAKRETVYQFVLYPIFKSFIDAINRHPQIFTNGDALRIDKSDKPNITVFADKLDGIELKNLKLKFYDKVCLKL